MGKADLETANDTEEFTNSISGMKKLLSSAIILLPGNIPMNVVYYYFRLLNV